MLLQCFEDKTAQELFNNWTCLLRCCSIYLLLLCTPDVPREKYCNLLWSAKSIRKLIDCIKLLTNVLTCVFVSGMWFDQCNFPILLASIELYNVRYSTKFGRERLHFTLYKKVSLAFAPSDFVWLHLKKYDGIHLFHISFCKYLKNLWIFTFGFSRHRWERPFSIYFFEIYSVVDYFIWRWF